MLLTRFFSWPGAAKWLTSAKVSYIVLYIQQTKANKNIAGKDSTNVLNYFSRNGAPCSPNANPAEHIVEVIQGNTEKPIDWVDVWNNSEERSRALIDLDSINETSKTSTPEDTEQADFATSKWFQYRLVLERLMTQLWRSPVQLSLALSLSLQINE